MFEKRCTHAKDGVELALGHLGALYHVALQLTQDPSDAEDLVHEAFLRGYRYVRGLADGDSCKAVLYTILLNVWRKERRRVQREVRLPDPADNPSWELPASRLGGMREGGDPEAAVEQKAFLVAFDRALAKLPPDLRVTVLLADIEGLTYQEMADLLGCPLGTVRSRLHRGRRWLAQELTPYADHGAREGCSYDVSPAGWRSLGLV
jgi:RNA polymerase sigma-70 factor, ECF subfamily